jgi:hypothetical protein
MKKFVTFVSALALCLMMVPKQAKAVGVSINAQAVVAQPMGDFGDGAGLGVGAMLGAKADIMVLVATLRVGYVHHLEKNVSNFSNIPILVGLRYQLPTPGINLFAGLEGGMNKSKVSVSIPGIGDSSVSDTNYGINAHVGANIGSIEITAGFSIMDLDNIDKSQAVMLTVGYDLFSLP